MSNPLQLPIYLDYMATTPVDPRVAKVMQAYLTIDGNFGNPASRAHSYGWQANEAVSVARQQVASLINAATQEIIFTSGATEANNLAILGAARFYQRKGKHVITYLSEHAAVIDPFEQLAVEGFDVTFLKPKKNGLIDLADLEKNLRQDTILVSLMQVNNEIGVIQDIPAVGRLLKPRGIIFHVDGAQSLGKIKVDIRDMACDLFSMSAHKVYGPKGIGALFVNHQPRVHVQPIMFGGGHEQGLRSGTLATHQIVGFGQACEIARQEQVVDEKRIAQLAKKLWDGIKILPDITLNGDTNARVANNLNICFHGLDVTVLLGGLADLAVSAGSACHSAAKTPSHVLKSLGLTDAEARASLRFSLGRFTTEGEIDYAIAYVCKIIKQLKMTHSLN